MATAIVLGWLATVAAITVVARNRWRLARGRRVEVLRDPPDDRSLPPGTPR